MKNSAVVTHWGFDAFDCLSSRLFKSISEEQISRVETFVSAFVLYDTIYLNERYADNDLVVSLNQTNPYSIKFVRKSELVHSDDMKEHISIDIDLNDYQARSARFRHST